MIHELLLGISGHSSPLLSTPSDKTDNNNSLLQDVLSPAERSLLNSLGQNLGEKNKEIRVNATAISSSHPSTVCRAVSTAIVATHLASFQRRILEVEKEILEQSTSIVGAYNIVPLSAVAGAFNGWDRKLGWLLDLVQFIQAQGLTSRSHIGQPRKSFCTAAELLKHLEVCTHTGYPDIEKISLDLLKVAETAWLKQISIWVLYGRYPTTGAADFLIIQRNSSHTAQEHAGYEFDVETILVPHFVTKATAQSVLSIGKALHYIRRRTGALTTLFPKATPEIALPPGHLAHLSSHLSGLKSPLSHPSFSASIGAIRHFLSQNALQKLLPMASIMQMLHILRDFFLMDNGEFAIALITAAEDRLTSRNKFDALKKSSVIDLASLTIKEGEVSTVLARAWNSLDVLQSLDPAYDENIDYIDKARSLIRLKIKSLETGSSPSQGLTDYSPITSFDDLLLPSSTVLRLQVQAPMDLFLTPPDIDMYSSMHAYLLAIRRAHVRLSKTFLLSALRRNHPSSSKAPPSSSNNDVSESLAHKRYKASQRARTMRTVWATIGSATFFIAEVGEYFQGQVVKSSWSTFHSWLLPSIPADTQSTDAPLMSSVGSGSRLYSSRPTSSQSCKGTASYCPRDPETLAQAHRRYLASLRTGLLLDDSKFTTSLRRLMGSIDHLTALLQRLNNIQQSLDLGTITESSSATLNLIIEAERLVEDLATSCRKTSSGVQALIEALRTIDAARTSERSYRATQLDKERDNFAPWNCEGVDRLLLKFDYGNAEKLLLQQSSDG